MRINESSIFVSALKIEEVTRKSEKIPETFPRSDNVLVGRRISIRGQFLFRVWNSKAGNWLIEKILEKIYFTAQPFCVYLRAFARLPFLHKIYSIVRLKNRRMKNASRETLAEHTFNTLSPFSSFSDREVKANISLWLVSCSLVCCYSQRCWVTSQTSSLPSARRGRSFRVSLVQVPLACVSLSALACRSYFDFFIRQTEFVRRKQSKTCRRFLRATSVDFYCDAYRIPIVFYETLFRFPRQYRKNRKRNSRKYSSLGSWL